MPINPDILAKLKYVLGLNSRLAGGSQPPNRINLSEGMLRRLVDRPPSTPHPLTGESTTMQGAMAEDALIRSLLSDVSIPYNSEPDLQGMLGGPGGLGRLRRGVDASSKDPRTNASVILKYLQNLTLPGN